MRTRNWIILKHRINGHFPITIGVNLIATIGSSTTIWLIDISFFYWAFQVNNHDSINPNCLINEYSPAYGQSILTVGGLYSVQLVGPTSMYTYQWVDENGLFMENGQAKNQP